MQESSAEGRNIVKHHAVIKGPIHLCGLRSSFLDTDTASIIQSLTEQTSPLSARRAVSDSNAVARQTSPQSC